MGFSAFGFFGGLSLLFAFDSIDRMRSKDFAVLQSHELAGKILGLRTTIHSFIYGNINQRKGIADFQYEIISLKNFDRYCVKVHARRELLNWRIINEMIVQH